MADASLAPRPSTARSAPAPNFLIVGAAKSGTTSLYHYLSKHPDVFLSPVRKEGRFYSGIGDGTVHWPAYYHFDTAKTEADYRALFEGHDGQSRIGDVSPDYFAYAHRAAPEILRREGPDTRIVVILRDPVSRAWSHYLQNVRRDAEFYSFGKTLDVEAERKAAGWGFQWLYTDTGDYAAKLPEYLDRFENVLVLLQDDLKADRNGTVRRVLDFLDLDPDAPLETEGRFNTGGIPRAKRDVLAGVHEGRPESFEALHAELVGGADQSGAAPSSDGVYPPIDMSAIEYPKMDPADRARLNAHFAPRIDALEALIGRDLSAWRGR